MFRDGEWNHKKKREFWQLYLGKNGMISALIPKIFEYMHPLFYLWQNDERRGFEQIFGQLRIKYGIQGFQYKEKELSKEKETFTEKKLEEETVVKY